mgnify:CR=1 FL=1
MKQLENHPKSRRDLTAEIRREGKWKEGKNEKNAGRNLFAKKFLSNIFYSPESIKIRFISRQSDGEAAAITSPSSFFRVMPRPRNFSSLRSVSCV